MELAAAAFSAIGSAVTSVGSAVATGASAVGSAAGSMFSGGSFLTTLLQGGTSILGAVSAMQQGKQQSSALEQQAAQSELDAGQQRLAGEQKSDELRRALLAEGGARDVAYAAAGLDSSFGTPAIARAQADDDTARALGVNAANTDSLAARYMQRAAGYRAQASAARSAGFYKAIGLVGETAISTVRRG